MGRESLEEIGRGETFPPWIIFLLLLPLGLGLSRSAIRNIAEEI